MKTASSVFLFVRPDLCPMMQYEAHLNAPDERILGEDIGDRYDVWEKDCGADDEIVGLQEEAEVDHEGVDHCLLDRGPAEVVTLEDRVAD